MKKILYTFLLISPLLFIYSCEEDVEGCMDSNAVNYNSEATLNDNSCLFDSDGDGIYDSDEIIGCLDSLACNFNINASDSDNYSCEYAASGFDCEGSVIAEIGDEFQGGILFYLDETGQYGLVAAMEDLSGTYEWGCDAIDINGDNSNVSPELQSIGTGLQNTLEIVAVCSETPIAASEALAYESEGYSDWFLPSKDELVEMYNTIGNGGPEGNIGGFSSNSNHWYWSSSEISNLGAWIVNFVTALEADVSKGSTRKVRVIRSF